MIKPSAPKTCCRLLAVALSTLFLWPSLARASGIQWQDMSVDEALAAASARGTLVLVDVYATWCGPCMRLDAEVFPTEEAGAAADGLIALRIDGEAGEGPAVMERFHVVGFPTVLLIDGEGAEIDRLFGFMPADEFGETLMGYRSGRGTIDQLRASVAAAPDNLEQLLELGERTAVRGEYPEARALLDRIIQADADNALGLRARAHLTLGKYMYLRGASDYPAAIAEFEILMTEFADSEEASSARFQTVIANIRHDDGSAAQAMIDEILARAAASGEDQSGVHNAVAWTCFREGFRLNGAIEIARRGLATAPDDHSLWDTLSELQFAVGDRLGAVESARRARDLDPTETYYQEQLDRFTAAANTD